MDNNKLTTSQLNVKQKFEQRLKYIFDDNASIIDAETGLRFYKFYFNISVENLERLNEHKADFAVLTEKCHNVEFCVEKDLICVYVQNDDFNEKETSFYKILKSHEYHNTKAVLPIPSGFDFFGKPVISDLRELSNLLCIGFVGSGIFEFIEGVVLSLSNKYAPNEFKVMLIESKNYALKSLDAFEGLPHLLGNKVYKTEEEIYEAFDAVVTELERRYDYLSRMGAPTIDVFNNSEKVKNGEIRALPYVAIIINKFENVISLNASKIEKYIQIITSRAKSCGMNLIICTEKATDDVLTKVVLRHVLSRLFFKTKQVSSKYLLLMPESDNLFNNGDMYLVPYLTKKAQRLQYGYISYQDCKTLVQEIRNKYVK